MTEAHDKEKYRKLIVNIQIEEAREEEKLLSSVSRLYNRCWSTATVCAPCCDNIVHASSNSTDYISQNQREIYYILKKPLYA